MQEIIRVAMTERMKYALRMSHGVDGHPGHKHALLVYFNEVKCMNRERRDGPD